MSGELHVALNMRRPPWSTLDRATLAVATLEAITLGPSDPPNVWFLSRDSAGNQFVSLTSLRKLVTAVRFIVAAPQAERHLADLGKWVDW
jgi:hypothetical protein